LNNASTDTSPHSIVCAHRLSNLSSTLLEGLQIAALCYLDQFSGDGAQVAMIVASADFHPRCISEWVS
jgi:hypothetical protein